MPHNDQIRGYCSSLGKFNIFLRKESISMAISLTRILGDDGPPLVIRISIHQMKISQNYSHASTLLFMLHHLRVFKYHSAYGIFTHKKNNKAQQETRGQRLQHQLTIKSSRHAQIQRLVQLLKVMKSFQSRQNQTRQVVIFNTQQKSIELPKTVYKVLNIKFEEYLGGQNIKY